jgi:hypothetical protein
LLANEDAGSVVEGRKSEKLQNELQTGRRDQSTLAPKQRLTDEASQKGPKALSCGEPWKKRQRPH